MKEYMATFRKSIAEIEAIVLEKYPLIKSDKSELKGKKRTAELSKVRNVTAYVAFEKGHTFAAIARYYQQKESSPNHAHRRLSGQLQVTPSLNREVSRILKEVE